MKVKKKVDNFSSKMRERLLKGVLRIKEYSYEQALLVSNAMLMSLDHLECPLLPTSFIYDSHIPQAQVLVMP
jgi:hypothetical protein